jgi:hypothetical protein
MLQNLVRILPEILALRRGMPVRGHSRHKPLATVLGFRLISKRRKYARTCRKMETPSPSHLSIICWKSLYAVLAAQSHSYRICLAKEYVQITSATALFLVRNVGLQHCSLQSYILFIVPQFIVYTKICHSGSSITATRRQFVLGTLKINLDNYESTLTLRRKKFLKKSIIIK